MALVLLLLLWLVLALLCPLITWTPEDSCYFHTSWLNYYHVSESFRKILEANNGIAKVPLDMKALNVAEVSVWKVLQAALYILLHKALLPYLPYWLAPGLLVYSTQFCNLLSWRSIFKFFCIQKKILNILDLTFCCQVQKKKFFIGETILLFYSYEL